MSDKQFLLHVYAPPSGGAAALASSLVSHSLTLRPTGVGSSSQWNPSAGSNYACVDEAVEDAADYVYDSTAGHIDTYAITGTVPTGAAIVSVTLYYMAQGQTTTDEIIQAAIRSGGSNGFSPNIPLLQFGTWTLYSAAFTTNPVTGLPWTVGEVNTMEIGQKRISGTSSTYIDQMWAVVSYTTGSAASDSSSPTAGAFIRAWPDVATLPSFRWAINSGPQAMSLTLPRAWGAAGEVGESGSLSDLAMENQVDTYVIDEDTDASGRLIHSGFIEDYEVNMPASAGVPITLIPYTSLFQDTFIQGPVVFTNEDPTDMMQAIVETYMPGITWNPNNPRLGLTFNQTIENMKASAAQEIIRRLAGSQWFYLLMPDNSLTFTFWNLRLPGTHQLNANHYANVKFKRSRQDVKTRVFLFGQKEQRDNDGVLTQPRIAVSVEGSNYNSARPRDLFVTDTRITDNGTAIRIANARLEYYRRDSIEGTIEVIDNNYDAVRGYDIESLTPGDTVEFFHPDLTYDRPKYDRGYHYNSDAAYGGVYASLVRGPLVISSILYKGTSAEVSLTTRPAGVVEELVGVADRLLLSDSA